MNLHKHLPNLNFFIMLSSLTGILGNISQSNYAAGNTFQDALARNRTANGLPAIVIDLGPVTEVEFVSEADGMRNPVEKSLGSPAVPIDRMLRLIEAAIRDPIRKHLDDSQVIMGIAQYDAIPEDLIVKKDRRFGTLRLGNAGATVARAMTGEMRRLEESVQARSNITNIGAKAVDLVSAALVCKLADLFSIAASEIDVSLPLSRYGVDSLVAVELRNWLSGVVKAKVSLYDILQTASLTDFAMLLVRRSGLVEDSTEVGSFA